YLSSPRSTKISRLSLHDALPISDSTVSPNDSSGVSFVQLELAFDKVRASECMCPPRTADSIRIALCPDPETEAVVAAREILRHVRAGGRYSDCGVLVRTLEDYHDTLRRVFGRYQIPFFLDRRESVAYH